MTRGMDPFRPPLSRDTNTISLYIVTSCKAKLIGLKSMKRRDLLLDMLWTTGVGDRAADISHGEMLYGHVEVCRWWKDSEGAWQVAGYRCVVTSK
jgi:hypothetical protein